uniref:Type VII secretion system protein EssD-like domain-containing protein n=1 Tax=Panagrolaimus sp. ES5 TaxID=591445 RepID=A0AC34GQN0_9BILA
MLLLFFYIVITVSFAIATNNRDNSVECPCPDELHDECTPKIYCVYGINDDGEIFHNVKNDPMNLTKIAIQRKEKLNNDDDVIVNLYNPKMKPTVIFYYGCRECEDLRKLGNFTESKLKIFLLSLYNQRMKYNIKYSQSDFKYFANLSDEVQAMPEISVRPFWKNRLMFNQTCAQKQQGFTQKHYIPAFLTQDLCILDYKYIGHSETPQTEDEYHTNNGEIRYSLTLSYTDLYAYDILDNSSANGICKLSFNLVAGKQFMRFFCLCNQYSCTLKVTQMNPFRFCPYELQIEINTTLTYTNIQKISDYMNADDFFMQSETTADKYCYFGWLGSGTQYTGYVKINDKPLNVGYGFVPNKMSCIFQSYRKREIEPMLSFFYNNDTWELRKAFADMPYSRKTIEDFLEQKKRHSIIFSNLKDYWRPDVIETPDGLIPHVEKDEQGRVVRAFGKIRGSMNVRGSRVSQRCRDIIQEHAHIEDDIGHIIPTVMGGSGKHLDNLFPQNATLNRGTAFCDRGYAAYLSENENNSIFYEMYFFYENDEERRPCNYGGIIGEGNDQTEDIKYLTYSETNYSSQKRTSKKSSPSFPSSVDALDLASNAAKIYGGPSINGLKLTANVAKGSVPALKIVSNFALPLAVVIDTARIASALASGDAKKIVKTGGKIATEWGAIGAGAVIGSAAGPLGTAVGAGVGAIVGAVTSWLAFGK